MDGKGIRRGVLENEGMFYPGGGAISITENLCGKSQWCVVGLYLELGTTLVSLAHNGSVGGIGLVPFRPIRLAYL